MSSDTEPTECVDAKSFISHALLEPGDGGSGGSDGIAARFEPGTRFGKYVIVRRLGEGSFSTVWEACERRRPEVTIAIKVYRSGDRNARYYQNELRMLMVIQQYREASAQRPAIVNYLGTHARVVMRNRVFPVVHPCVRFELAGDHIGRLLRAGPFSLCAANSVMRQLLGALAFLHERNIIHTDIKPENLFLCVDAPDLADACTHGGTCSRHCGIRVVLGDLGTATFADSLFSRSIGTVPYLSPETLVSDKYDASVDIWAAYAMYFEMVTGSLLFDIYSECNIDYGDDLTGFECGNCDTRSSAGSRGGYTGADADADTGARSDADTGACSERGAHSVTTGASADGTRTATGHSENSDDFHISSLYHLMIMEKIMGRPPKKFWQGARDFFNRKGKLKENPEIAPLPMAEILTQQYDFDTATAQSIEQFVRRGVQYLPEQRVRACDDVQYP